jgi:exodeoxyribonuclease VII small subunit
MSKTKSPQDKPAFEVSLAEIEGIVARIESGQLSLDESLAAYRRGAELLKHCQGQLADAERQLRILDEDALKPFEPAAEDSR